MDFSKPIYGEVEGFIDASAAEVYFKNNGIKYMEQVEDGYYSGGFKNIIIFKSGKRKNRYFFKFPVMAKEQLERATKDTEVKFYQ